MLLASIKRTILTVFGTEQEPRYYYSDEGDVDLYNYLFKDVPLFCPGRKSSISILGDKDSKPFGHRLEWTSVQSYSKKELHPDLDMNRTGRYEYLPYNTWTLGGYYQYYSAI